LNRELIMIGLKLFAALLLVLLNGFFVAAEFALVKIRETQLDTLIAKGHRRAKIARSILGNLNESLSAAQLGITLASLGLGWIGEPVFSSLLAPLMDGLGVVSSEWRHLISFVVGFSVITFLHISAGEQAPKALAIQRPLATTLRIAAPLRWFFRASYPLVWLLNHTSLWLLRQVGIEPINESDRAHSEEELRLLIAASRPKSAGLMLPRNIVLNALALRHRIAREVMRPRQEIVGLNTESNLAECLDIAEKTRFSRFPQIGRAHV
jgi:CBS domain containing-hemolysin-like protein